MPNIKSAKKRVKVTKVKALNNQMVKNALKTCLKKYDSVVASGDKAEAEAMYKITVKKVDQAAAKGILHKNTAARKKSQLTNMLNSIGA
ncbi:30S ribosomal protein S20 [Feifania hominis]|uniref:Small ribosomal subunit protein bS20 n=1 Tax=Feifania hominis TaxID=2763660 RepID=A0A926HTX2_9FIRM|nr:30S ribosomal protein S20 [Feifania hominis]MBC8536299.1 30S ribosomal protein S20 [Feifania hominis]